jgi:hypothetical protein
MSGEFVSHATSERAQEVLCMTDLSDRFRADKAESTLLVLFIPSVDRKEQPIDQETWVSQALELLGQEFGGATAFPRARGVWRDDMQGGRLVFDEPVIIQCYTNEQALEAGADRLREFLVRMGTETNQGAVGLVIDHDYLEIRLPWSEVDDG